MNGPQFRIQLSVMPQLAEARHATDDWTGTADAKARRRAQGRLNTRAYRRRKALQAASAQGETEQTANADVIPCWDESRQCIFHLPASLAKALTSSRRPFIDTTSPVASRLLFPLSSDHLITLIQMNVFRAILCNTDLISGIIIPTQSHCNGDCTNGSIHKASLPTNGREVPSTLAPTAAQRAIPHERWVDVLPHPAWRDNFLRALEAFDEDDLCSDLVGELFDESDGGSSSTEAAQRGVVVWSPPWSYEGWELSEGFVRKWGWSIRGCDGLLEATNKWRAKRGEEPLVLEECYQRNKC